MAPNFPQQWDNRADTCGCVLIVILVLLGTVTGFALAWFIK